ncbi:MAG: hypothetical protein E7074_01430 [Bacteroidales bacterium]|nr:hypothetical protein [Bacteroidales bacterium]
MRYFCLYLMICLCLYMQAGVIVTSSNGNIDNVEIIEVTDTDVKYKQEDSVRSIPIEVVDALLYDDGRYVTIPHIKNVSQIESTGKEKTEQESEQQQARRQRKSELQQTFKQAGAAMKDAFSTLFNVKKKEKEPTQTPTESSLKTETTSSNEDNW